MTAPTSLKGFVTDYPDAYGAVFDVLEHVPDLHYPLSIPVFGQMRREPALAAVLAAYTLPLRRASWAVDPTGCRPEVAQLVADDLGLPVVGDDTPGAARTRGVSWPQHIRSALGHLTFGHAAFEMLAELRDGRARLVGLFERMQPTIQEIHVDKQGRLLGISQEMVSDKRQPQIPAERLVWYAHEAEGAALYGSSILRPSFGFWLIKQDCIRVAATSNRRFAMGVPTVEWAPGATPTPQQMQQAQQAASAARVGEQAGMSLPPGATLILKGLTGSVPDTIGLLRYLDGMMSRSVLTGFLDLGTSDTGSRALSESFVDLFTLSLGAIAGEVADTATTQIAARIVGWNWGDGEPVPKVVASDVGTKHDVTAEAIQQLMAAGALTPDPALEAYVRRTFRLPQREQNSPPPLPKSPEQTQPVAASRPRARSKRAQSSGQGSLFAAAADDEDGAAEFQQQWEQARTDALAAWPVQAEPLVDDLAQQVEDRLTAGDVAKLAAVVVASSAVAGVASWLLGLMNPLSVASAGTVLAAAKAQGVKTRAMRAAGAASNRQVAQVQAQLLATSYAQAAVRAALLAAGPGVNPGQVAETVRQHLNDLATSGNGLVADAVGASLSAAQAAGRRAVFDKYPPKQFRAVEANDRSSCQPCKEIDGRVLETLAEVDALYPVAGYVGCLGGSRCRGHAWPEWS